MRRALARGFTLLAGAVLAIALLVICLRTGSFWPWSLVVHEDGVRTLTATILYYEHATRELPIDILLGVAIGGSVLFAYPPSSTGPRHVMPLALASAAVIAVIVVGATAMAGLPVMLDNLLQRYTRPGLPLIWGGHWRYHLASRLALILASLGLAGLIRLLTDRGQAGGGRAGLRVVGVVLVLYLALTILFAHSWSALLLVLRHPIPLGHQARELVTHALVTVPLGWAGCLLAVRGASLGPASGRVTAAVALALIAGVAGTLLAAYVGIAALLADAASHGQTSDLAMLIFPHFFEHSFTYLVVPAVAALVYETVASRART
jgi:hypothetical protein